jgi:hypothetical protein
MISRFFVVSTHESLNSSEVVNREINYAFKWLKKELNNECPWNYIRGLMRNAKPNKLTTANSTANTTANSEAVSGAAAANAEGEGEEGSGELVNNNDNDNSTGNGASYWRFKQYPNVKSEILLLHNNHNKQEAAKESSSSDDGDGSTCIPLLSLYSDILEDEIKDNDLSLEVKLKSFEELNAVFEKLCLLDKMRLPYW